jgi:hypothetical protein
MKSEITYKHSDFTELLKDPENQKCFDCGYEQVAWASINNSIYLCLLCSGVHRSFGVSISSIRSLTIDDWNHNQISFMKVGGNRRLAELLQKYEVSRETLPHILYNSKLLAYHKRLVIVFNLDKE